MKRLLFLFTLSAILLQSCIAPQDRHNQDHLLYATIWYQRSPEQKALYYQGFNIATRQLEEYVRKASAKPKAVVVDIDETMLDNSPFEVQEIIDNTEFNDKSWHEWCALAKAEALPGAVEFTKYCESIGVEVFYISNRKTDESASTLKNLDSLGFAYARPENLYLKENESSKASRMRRVSDKFDIVMLIGDNLNDFSEVFEERGDDWGISLVEQYRNEFGSRYIILPNPMYGAWEKSIYKSNGVSDMKKEKLRLMSLKGYNTRP